MKNNPSDEVKNCLEKIDESSEYLLSLINEDVYKRQPHSRSRLPNMRKPTRATLAGATSPAMTVTRMGNRILVKMCIRDSYMLC